MILDFVFVEGLMIFFNLIILVRISVVIITRYNSIGTIGLYLTRKKSKTLTRKRAIFFRQQFEFRS